MFFINSFAYCNYVVPSSASLWEKLNPLVFSELNYIDTKEMTNVALSFHRCSLKKYLTKCANK